MTPTLTKHQKIGIGLTMVSSLQLISAQKERREGYGWKNIWAWEINCPICKFLAYWNSNYLRVGAEQFEEILSLVAPFIEKENTVFRDSVSARHRLVVTLRFLATGNPYQDLRCRTTWRVTTRTRTHKTNTSDLCDRAAATGRPDCRFLITLPNPQGGRVIGRSEPHDRPI